MIPIIQAHRTANGHVAVKSDNILNMTLQKLFGGEVADASTRQIFEAVGYFKRCVTIRARSAASVPYEIRNQRDDIIASDTMQARDGLQFLNDLQMLVYCIELSKVLEGGSYTLIEQDRGAVTGLFPMSPTTIKSVKTSQGIVAFDRTLVDQNGKTTTIRYPVEDVLHVFEVSPYVEMGAAASDAYAARDAGSVLYYLTDFLAKHAQRGLIKGTLLTVDVGEDEALDEKERAALKTSWRRLMRMFRREPDEVDVISADVKPITVGEGVKELSNSELSKEQQETIATSFGVPHSLVMSNAANYATANIDQTNFYTTTVLPSLDLIVTAINRQLLRRFGFTMYLLPKKLEVFQRYELEKAASLRALTDAPVMTVNEARAMLDLEEIDDERFNTIATSSQMSSSTSDDLAVQRTFAKSQEELLSIAYERDIKNWKRRVSRRGVDVVFKPDFLPQSYADVITERLKAGFTTDDAFRPPFTRY